MKIWDDCYSCPSKVAVFELEWESSQDGTLVEIDALNRIAEPSKDYRQKHALSSSSVLEWGFEGGRFDVHAAGWSFGVADPGENLGFGSWPVLVMVTSYAFLKESSSEAPMERMMVLVLSRSTLRGIILEKCIASRDQRIVLWCIRVVSSASAMKSLSCLA
jgi:hypothetical protein